MLVKRSVVQRYINLKLVKINHIILFFLWQGKITTVRISSCSYAIACEPHKRLDKSDMTNSTKKTNLLLLLARRFKLDTTNVSPNHWATPKGQPCNILIVHFAPFKHVFVPFKNCHLYVVTCVKHMNWSILVHGSHNLEWG